MTARISTFVLLAFFATAPAGAQQAAPQEPSIVTTGEGTVHAVPDRAWITVSAESRAGNPRDAQRRNAEAMNPVLARLKSAGVPADAIRTVAYDLQYEWDFVDGKRVGRGYVARNTIDVRVDAIDRLGEYLDIVVRAGATSLGGIRFDFKDRKKLEREALRLAVEDARAKAEAAAVGAGRTLDRILRIEEAPEFGGPIPMPRVAREAFQAADAASVPPISTGEAEVRARVTMTVGIR